GQWPPTDSEDSSFKAISLQKQLCPAYCATTVIGSVLSAMRLACSSVTLTFSRYRPMARFFGSVTNLRIKKSRRRLRELSATRSALSDHTCRLSSAYNTASSFSSLLHCCWSLSCAEKFSTSQ